MTFMQPVRRWSIQRGWYTASSLSKFLDPSQLWASGCPKPQTLWHVASATLQTLGYLPSFGASPPSRRHRIIPFGKRGRCAWAAT